MIRRRIPLARRNLLADPRRLATSALGVGMAVMLILLVDGLWEGVKAGVTTYEDGVGADLYVAQPGTRNFFGATSTIPDDTLTRVRDDPDVAWATRVRGFFSILDLHDQKVPAYVVGTNPGDRGGPWEIHEGRPPRQDDEVVIGRIAADRHGIDVGEPLEILGRQFEVVGTSTDAFMVTFLFMTHTATDDLLGAPDTTSFVLAGTDRPTAVRDRLEESGLAVLEADELADNDLSLMTRAYGVPLRVMVIVAFLIGSLVIALTGYTAIAEHAREYGIVKALGARRGYLLAVAVQQTAIIASVGLVAGAIFYVAGRELIMWARPQFLIVATPVAVARAVGATVLMGLVAALLPARRLATLDPATAYRGGT